MKDLNTRDLTTTALLAILIIISGTFRIPSPLAGGEFQLSSPIAVLICACFGFKRYIIAGVRYDAWYVQHLQRNCTNGIPSCCRWHNDAFGH